MLKTTFASLLIALNLDILDLQPNPELQ